jgi:hypothetical protein
LFRNGKPWRCYGPTDTVEDAAKHAEMRIVEDTLSHLRLRDRTYWISVICFGAAAALLARVAVGWDEPSGLIPAALFVVFGVAFLRATDVTLDKAQRICAVRRLDLLRLRRTQLAFGDIMDVQVEIGPSPDSADAISCRLSLVTAAGLLPLTASYEPDLARYEAMRGRVLDVVVGNARRPPAADPVRLLIKQGRAIDAIAVLRKRDGLDLATAHQRVTEMQKAAER